MIIDFSANGLILDDYIPLPDWNFPNASAASNFLGETISITGSSTTTTSIGGEVDSPLS